MDATDQVLVVDTGVLVAAADTSDRVHRECAELVGDHAGQLVTTALVIAEAAYLLNREIGPDAEAALYTSIIEGDLNVDNLNTHDWVRIRELVTTYADLHLGGTDASVITIAERRRIAQIATIDHRHFHVVRPNHVEAFTLLP